MAVRLGAIGKTRAAASRYACPDPGLSGTARGGRRQVHGELNSGTIYGRCNWFIAATGARRWIAGPPEIAFAHVTADNAGETLFVRSERQTLRRLPRTGAILFTIGIYVEPLGALSSAGIARLAEAISHLVQGEDDRRGSRVYASSLVRFAKLREGC